MLDDRDDSVDSGLAGFPFVFSGRNPFYEFQYFNIQKGIEGGRQCMEKYGMLLLLVVVVVV